MQRRVVLGAIMAAFLVPLGVTTAPAQSSAQRADRETLRTQKRAVKRLRRTEKKLFKRRKRKAKQLLKTMEEGRVRIIPR
jgi:hypothetical protein